MAANDLSGKDALARAVEIAGGQTAFAKSLTSTLGREVSQQRVWNVLNRDQDIPAEWCMATESITGGKIKARQLRPEIYVKPSKAVA